MPLCCGALLCNPSSQSFIDSPVTRSGLLTTDWKALSYCDANPGRLRLMWLNMRVDARVGWIHGQEGALVALDCRNLKAAWHRANTALGAPPRPSNGSVSTRE